MQKLAPYIGGNSQLWHYTASHCMLTIRVYKKGISDSFITFNFVERIEIETMWKIKAPMVSGLDSKLSEFKDSSNSIIFEGCLFSPEAFKIA